MKKRIFSILLCLCMVLTLFPVTAFAEGDDTAELQALLNAGGTVTLEKDYTVTSTLKVNNTVTLDLNGHVVKMTGGDSVLWVMWSNSLTLQDSDPTAVHTGENASLPAGGVLAGGEREDGGGVYNMGSFTMNGGTISNCTATYGGGGVYNNSGSFTMNGGTIIHCTAPNGSGVYNGIHSSFTMNGGSIVENSGSANVCNANGTAAVFVNGGEITGLYNSVVVNIEKDADKSGTIFYGEVKNSLGTINAGIFKGAVTNSKYYDDTIPGTISGGTFEGTVTNENDAVISGGTFMGQVVNSGIISGGMFYGGISGGNIRGNTVTFMKDGSSYALEVVAAGNKVAAPIEPVVPAGMRFTGWYTDEALTDKYEFGSTLPESITLYADLEPATYTVTYDGGEEIEGSIEPDTKLHGVPVTLSGETFTRDGFIQTGWVDGQGAVYDLGGTYTAEQDVTLYPVWEKLVTVTVPFTTTVALGDKGVPGKTVFELGLIDSEGNELTFDGMYFGAEIITDGVGDYTGEVTITATERWLYDMLYEGAFIWQYDGEEEGWMYDDTVWGVRLYQQTPTERSVSDVTYSLLIYPAYNAATDDSFSFRLDLDAGPVDEMHFTNTYTKSVEEPEGDNPGTGDHSDPMMWIALLAVSAAGAIGAGVYRKRRKDACAK